MIEPTQTAIPHRPQGFLAALLLLVVPLGFYFPACDGGFLWDDDSYLEQNPSLTKANGLAEIWFEPQASPQYYPLVFSTFWVEHRLWGLNSTGYHIVNILLHALSAVLLWRILVLLKLPGAWLAAMLFAIHPVHVESVAWITERKNTMSGFFALAAALTYLHMRRDGELDGDSSSETGRRFPWGRYLAVLLLFACALFSKTVTASLPAVLLVVAWWKRGKISRRELLETLPMLLIAIPLAMHTAWLERVHVGAAGAQWDFSFAERLLIAGRAAWFYAGKLIAPTDLTFIYPRWSIDATAWWQYLYPAAAIAIVGAGWLFRKRIGRGPLAALLIFGGVLLPASGFFDVYPMRYSFVADHFQYHASIALLALFACALTRLCARMDWEHLQPILSVLLIGVLGVLTLIRCYAFSNAETLWRDTLAKNPGSAMAHTNLGDLLQTEGRTAEALEHFQQAVKLAPEEPLPALSLGALLFRINRRDESVVYLRKAVELDPTSALALTNLGAVLTDHGDPHEALRILKKAVELEPETAAMHYNLGRGFLRLGRRDEALRSFAEAKRLNPQLKIPQLPPPANESGR